MEDNHYITASQEEAAINTPIRLQYHKMNQNTGIAPYAREYIRQFMKNWCANHQKPDGDNYDPYSDGLKIYTTINPKIQMYSEQAMDKHLAELQKIFNQQYDIKNGAIWKKNENYLTMFMKNSDRLQGYESGR
jgi:penicillin-binding protein 1A